MVSRFTGEDCCEFQVHGSLAVVSAMYDALSLFPGLRMAKPGEFTKRAFFNGKLDLTEVEGLADLIHAETEVQRKQALLQSTGCLSRVYKNWRERLIRDIAHLEAYIDFAEDENIEDDVVENINKDLESIKNEISKHLNDQRQGEMLRNGVRTVIIGAPNVGKSSLLNLLCQRQVSIVTSIAGTTRDIIESPYNIGGYPVLFADTAGLRQQTEDVIETEGINRAVEYLQQSNFVLLVADAMDVISSLKCDNSNISAYKCEYLKKLGINIDILNDKVVLLIANKKDLLEKQDEDMLRKCEDMALISCKYSLNLDNVLKKMTVYLEQICGEPSVENPRLTHSRYRNHLQDCVQSITDFLSNYSPDTNPDLAIAAHKLRKAVRCIEQITGDVSTEEILDVIFKDFCIGK